MGEAVPFTTSDMPSTRATDQNERPLRLALMPLRYVAMRNEGDPIGRLMSTDQGGDVDLLLLRDAFDALPEAVAIFDREDRFVFWNRRFAEIYGEGVELRAGLRFEDHLRASLAKGLVSAAIGREEEWLADRLARFDAGAGAHEHKLANGRWVRVQDRDLANGGKIGIRSDITEAMDREQSFRLLFDANPAPMIVTDLHTLEILAVNAAAVAFYGYPRDVFLTLSIRDIRFEREPGDLQAPIEALDDQSLAGGLRSHRIASGEERVVRYIGRKLDYAGRPSLLSAFFDLTEQHRMEEEVRRTRAFLNEVVDHVPTAVFAKDMQRGGRYMIFNRASEALFGRARGEVIGRTDGDVFDAEAAAGFAVQDQATLRLGAAETVEEATVRRPDGEARSVRTRKIAVADARGGLRFVVGASEDVTEQRASEARAAYMAHHDALTALPNRFLFGDRLSSSLARVRAGQDLLAVLFLDLDGFKATNDTWGHAVGDGLLQVVAERLRGALRDCDTAARFGGDEFAILQVPIGRIDEVSRLAERLVSALSAPYVVGRYRPRVSASIGIALAPLDAVEGEVLMESADIALYRAKREGGNAFRFASPNILQAVEARKTPCADPGRPGCGRLPPQSDVDGENMTPVCPELALKQRPNASLTAVRELSGRWWRGGAASA